MKNDPFRLGGAVRLLPGRDAAARRGHPWVYRGSLAGPLPSETAPLAVLASTGERLGVALPGASGGSLALRFVARGEEPWDAATLRRKLAAATTLRRRLALDTDAYRLVHAEGDGLPALVIDRYADHAAVELYEPAWEPYLEAVAGFLTGEMACATVLVRRAWTGERRPEALVGGLPVAPLPVREGRLELLADLVHGQKTGLFLDQRETRRRVAELAGGCEVLNLFAYTGGFAVAALGGGAVRVVNVESSAPALALARATYEANGFPVAEGDFLREDAFAATRRLLEAGARFDLVIVDPPAFVKRKADRAAGLAGYRDINLQAVRLTRPGGLLVTCSCSALVSEEQFAGALLAAALDAGRDLVVLERRGAGPDHPVLLACPETRHLKVFVCRVGS